MKIILDLRGWKKEIILDDKTASIVANCGSVEIGILKPLDLLVKDSDIKMNEKTKVMSIRFHHFGFFIDNKPIYKYNSKGGD